jgi:hypothetical protein
VPVVARIAARHPSPPVADAHLVDAPLRRQLGNHGRDLRRCAVAIEHDLDQLAGSLRQRLHTARQRGREQVEAVSQDDDPEVGRPLPCGRVTHRQAIEGAVVVVPFSFHQRWTPAA